MLASSLATLAAVAGTATTAHACSIAPPYVEVWPATDLRPGQKIEIAGWGFSDIRMHEPAQPGSPDEPDRAAPPELCDFDFVPISDLDVSWQGNISAYLGSVAGPDFVLNAVVPEGAAVGHAVVNVGGTEAAVTVRGNSEPPTPPPPCALSVQPNPDGSGCPEPWPCPMYGNDRPQTQPAPAPAADYAPGLQPLCPEPCVDYAHTTDDGTVYDYQWDCPDPCSQTQVSPGAGDAALAVWCPPPEPCPVYLDGGAVSDTAEALAWCPDPCEVVGGDAVWCPPPEPCPVYLDGGAVSDTAEALAWCPDPCEVVGGDAVWCPPEPCPLFPAGPGESDAALAWCPPPEPCPVHLDGGAAQDAALVYCPDPCQLVGGDAVWCPPEPCPLFPAGPGESDAALAWCPSPEPCPVHLDGGAAQDAALVYCPDPCQLVGGDAVWCPPEPCPLSPAGPDDAQGWCTPPIPCLADLDGGSIPDAALATCPDPCEGVGGEAVLCPPPPPCADPNTDQFCIAVENAPASTSLPAPDAPAEPDASTADDDSIVTTAATQIESASAEAMELQASSAIVNIIELIIRRIAEAIGSARLSLFN